MQATDAGSKRGSAMDGELYMYLRSAAAVPRHGRQGEVHRCAADGKDYIKSGIDGTPACCTPSLVHLLRLQRI